LHSCLAHGFGSHLPQRSAAKVHKSDVAEAAAGDGDGAEGAEAEVDDPDEKKGRGAPKKELLRTLSDTICFGTGLCYRFQTCIALQVTSALTIFTPGIALLPNVCNRWSTRDCIVAFDIFASLHRCIRRCIRFGSDFCV
jgi:hypothetical protein